MEPMNQAAIAAILAPSKNLATLELLLIQRSLRPDDPWSGHMALPGGRRDPLDPDLRATAVRETREELGLELESARLLGRLDDLHPIRQSERRLAVRPYVFFLAQRPELTLSHEVAAALWVSLDKLAGTLGQADVEHRGARLVVPAYILGERIVWGMTQRVLAGLLELALFP